MCFLIGTGFKWALWLVALFSYFCVICYLSLKCSCGQVTHSSNLHWEINVLQQIKDSSVVCRLFSVPSKNILLKWSCVPVSFEQEGIYRATPELSLTWDLVICKASSEGSPQFIVSFYNPDNRGIPNGWQIVSWYRGLF